MQVLFSGTDEGP